MSQWVKFLLCNPGELRSGPQHPKHGHVYPGWLQQLSLDSVRPCLPQKTKVSGSSREYLTSSTAGLHTHTQKYFLRCRGMLLFGSPCLQQPVTTSPAMHSLPHTILHTNKIRGNDLFHPLACYFWKAAGVLGDTGFLNCLRPSDIAALQPSLEWARKKIKIITLMLRIKVYWLSLEVKTKKAGYKSCQLI